MYLSKSAAIEKSSLGIGVSVMARKYWRGYYAQQGVANMLGDNAFVNDAIAGDFSNAQPLHRFWLRSGEPAEIRRSHAFYYVAAMRGPSQYDIIVIQSRYKESDPELSKRRLTPEWVQEGPRKRRTQ
jgi:hypothetical protein